MERFLLISGRIISFIFVAVGVVLLVLMLAAILFVNATSVVPAFGQNLVNDHVIDDLRPAIWQTITDAIPPEVQIGDTTIQTGPLVLAFERSVDDIIDSGLPLDEWLQTRAEQVFTQVVTEVRGSVSAAVQTNVEGFQDALAGSDAAPLVDLLLAALDQCTDAQVAEIQNLLGAGPSANLSVAVSFLCRPPESLGVNARDLMRNVLTLVLAEVGDRAASEIESRLSQIDLSKLSIDTPLGPASLDWPNIRLGSGLFSVSVPIPDNIVQAVEEAAAQLSAQASQVIGQAVAEATQQADDARATLSAAGSALATEAATRVPSTGTPTEVPPTATPLPTAEPTQTPEEADAERNAVSASEQRVLDLTSEIGNALADAAAQLTTVLLLVLGIPLLIHAYLQLYLMRTLRLWGLWIALVLTISGIILFVIDDRLTTAIINPLTQNGDSPLPAPLASVAASARLALQNALQSELGTPFQTTGLLLTVIGVVLIAVVVFLFWRDRAKRNQPVPEASQS